MTASAMSVKSPSDTHGVSKLPSMSQIVPHATIAANTRPKNTCQ